MDKSAAIKLWEKRFNYFIVHKAICNHVVGKNNYQKDDYGGWDWEYLYPLSQGGSEEEANLGLICTACQKARAQALEGHFSNGRDGAPTGAAFKIIAASADSHGKKIGKLI